MSDLHNLHRDIHEQLASADRGPGSLEALDAVVDTLISPAVVQHGVGPVFAHLVEHKDDPYVAAVIVDASGESGSWLRREGEPATRVTDVFSDEEIIEGALSYLAGRGDAGLGEGRWAWTALWNGWSQLRAEDQLRLIVALIDRLPNDEELWAMVADGPFREVANSPETQRAVADAAKTDVRLSRLFELM